MARPADHECALCRLTSGVRGMDGRWRQFTRSLGLPVAFLHRDEFREQFATSPLRDVELPAAVVEDRGALCRSCPPGRCVRPPTSTSSWRRDRRTPAGR